ncbi:hypothetical protein COY52_08240 [Candidatus Desantisbacteria bacterium CG_4_10_14_0_8_um_filter_48_22]|uniref:Peptide transporter n=1 Tax=Candidatus Desantisbacteria bacterium CG_4_10_14_0_8_um_filter_48_22 TaxID=1974543 RepID=A0A2M7S981_9BACT|nr:MAG: hypothetical protein AUJ67_05055 [Candidatus Desantisbacteria bacterium CG1_02_49_89]PIV54542.1 MAG: hypothetical protein COS16_09905 [Candidatus Desantisbacteria bacterium CG02_land_8_20_14_3_00_49_13]PIZ16029.1 MAG: hypothetical protein COY52_08240 [Candidatus Desantisbacteria bacterium CG_4_10_14_0_8_um_filter_48_22]
MEEQKGGGQLNGLTWKGVIVGLICVAFISIFSPFSDLVVGTVWSGAEFLPVNVVFTFTVLVLVVNFLLKKMKVGLNQSELMFIYSMMLVSGCIASLGLVHSLIPITTKEFYAANPTNRWAQILHPYLVKWLVPANPSSITYLWEGLPLGMKIPWGDWVRPFVSWIILALSMYLVMFCVVVLMRKQWVQNEKLMFPLVSLPLEMAKEEEGHALSPFFRDKVMWIGFAIPAVILTLNGLHHYFPFVPQIQLNLWLSSFIKTKPWDGLNPINLAMIFSALGLTYLLPTQLSFSLWFFYFFFRLQAIAGSAMGFPMPMMFTYPTRAFIGYQIAGGMMVFAGFLFWAARAEIKRIFTRAFSREKDPEEANEPVSYRTALLGLIAGLLFIGFWGMAAGASFWLILIIFIIFFLIVISASRLAAEGGIYFFQASFRPSDLIMAFTGSTMLGTNNIATLIGPVEHVFMRDQRSVLMPSLFDSMKITDAAKLKPRHTTIVIALGILVTILISYPTYIALMYKIGGVNCTGYTWAYGPEWGSMHSANLLNNPVKANPKYILSMFIGVGSMIFLLWMRRMFLWWPFHPLGYIMGDSWPTVQIWFPIMLGWAIKSLVMRFGGIKVYRRLMPGFLGLILGEFFVKGLWVVIDMFTGIRGHTVAPFL